MPLEMSNIYLQAAAGGALIGLSASLLLLLSGRIAGISGILHNLVLGRAGRGGWRVWFVLGLVISPAIYALAGGELAEANVSMGMGVLIVAGLLVGFGTRLGSGCTSGHGVCGLSNLSRRSLVATLTFMGAAMMTVYFVRHWGA